MGRTRVRQGSTMEFSVDRAIYVGLAALVGLAIWFGWVTGFTPHPDQLKRRSSTDPRSAELLRARKNVVRQIEQERSYSRRGVGYSSERLQRLTAILEEIEAELSEQKTAGDQK